MVLDLTFALRSRRYTEANVKSTTLWQACDRACLAGELQDVQPAIGAIDDIDVAALVGLDIVGLDRNLAALLALDGHATFIGLVCYRRNEIADFPGVIGIADVERAHPGIEEGDERHLPVKHRRHALVGGVRAETPATRAEIALASGTV